MLLMLAGPAAAATPLDGQWESGTVATTLHHVRITHRFEGDRATMTTHIANAVPYQIRGVTVTRTGTFAIRGPSPAVAGAVELDIRIERITLTLLDPDSVWLANRSGDQECGLTGWELGVPRDVTGRYCDGDLMAAAGDVEKLLARASADTLELSPYWGSGAVEPGPVATTQRATTLDTTRPLHRGSPP